VLVFLLAFFLDFFEIAFIIIPLIGPAAEKIGIDLIWLGVMLGVNMQTSFMHPPFGFALFYLRSVAPRVPYKDRTTGTLVEPVTTGQIYWGAVPFVIIQCVMVGLVIAFPAMVMHYKSTGPAIDPSKIEIQLPPFGGSGPGGLNLPSGPGGLPPGPSGLNLGPPPFGLPGGNFSSGPAGLTTPPPLPQGADTTGSGQSPAPPAIDVGKPSELQPGASPDAAKK
jgi:hypothetical protein